MRRFWAVPSIIVVLGLVWFTIPAIGGWSWASDPEFIVDGSTVNVQVVVSFDEEPDAGDLKKVKVELRVPKGTSASVTKPGDFMARVKSDHMPDGYAVLIVTVPGNCLLEDVAVTTGAVVTLPIRLWSHKQILILDLLP